MSASSSLRPTQEWRHRMVSSACRERKRDGEKEVMITDTDASSGERGQSSKRHRDPVLARSCFWHIHVGEASLCQTYRQDVWIQRQTDTEGEARRGVRIGRESEVTDSSSGFIIISSSGSSSSSPMSYQWPESLVMKNSITLHGNNSC